MCETVNTVIGMRCGLYITGPLIIDGHPLVENGHYSPSRVYTISSFFSVTDYARRSTVNTLKS